MCVRCRERSARHLGFRRDSGYFSQLWYDDEDENSILAVLDVACRSASKTTNALGRNWAWLYFYGNLSGDPTRDGHGAGVNDKITKIRELISVRERPYHICEFTECEAEELLGHISTFGGSYVGSVHGYAAVMFPGFAVSKQQDRGASMVQPISFSLCTS